MKREVFWKNPGYKVRSSLKGKVDCDYLIVGCGVAGVSTAYFLTEMGAKNIVMVDKHTVASGATGRAAGTLAAHGELDLRELIEKHGRKKGLKYWNANFETLRNLGKIVKKHKIDCDYELLDEFFAGYKYKNSDDPLEEYDNIKGTHKSAKLLRGSDIKKVLNTEIFHHALYLKNSCVSVNPLKLTQNLSRIVEKRGVKIYENTEVLDMGTQIAETKHGSITFKKAVVCIDTYEPDRRIRSLRSTIVVTDKLSKREIEQTKLGKSRLLIFDSKENYNYLKMTADDRLLVGFGGITVHKKHHKSDPHFPHLTQIETFVRKLFPYITFKFDYAWSGNFGVTDGYYPVIERKDNTYTLAGCGSQVVCMMSGRHVASKLLGKKSKLDGFFKD